MTRSSPSQRAHIALQVLALWFGTWTGAVTGNSPWRGAVRCDRVAEMTKQDQFVHFAMATAIIGASARSAAIATQMTNLLSAALATPEQSIPEDWRNAVEELMRYSRGKGPRPNWAPEIPSRAGAKGARDRR